MGRSRKTGREFKGNLDAIKESCQSIVENTKHTNEKMDDLKKDISEIKKSSTSKLPVIIAIIGVVVTLSGVTVVGIIDRWKSETESDVTIVDDKYESEPEYKIFLYPEYSTFNIGKEIDMTASLNFETDNVIITAHLASGGEDTVSLERKNAVEWKKKVQFTETGVHKIVVTATAPSGEVVENSIEVEVTPVNIDSINQFFSQ